MDYLVFVVVFGHKDDIQLGLLHEINFIQINLWNFRNEENFKFIFSLFYWFSIVPNSLD